MKISLKNLKLIMILFLTCTTFSSIGLAKSKTKKVKNPKQEKNVFMESLDQASELKKDQTDFGTMVKDSNEEVIESKKNIKAKVSEVPSLVKKKPKKVKLTAPKEIVDINDEMKWDTNKENAMKNNESRSTEQNKVIEGESH